MSRRTAVVILNWNRHDDTIACINSLRQTKNDISIIVVDNASEKISVNALKEREDIDLYIQSGVNGGFAKGNNLGILAGITMDCDSIWILNNDTLVDPECLSEMRACLFRDPGIGAVGSKIVDTEHPFKTQALGGGRVNWILGFAKHIVRDGNIDKLDYLTGASILVKKEVFQSAGLLPEDYFMYWEDVEFSLRIRQSGYRIVYCPSAIVYHNESSSIKKYSEAQAKYYNTSSSTFFRRNAAISFLPILIGRLGRTVKSIYRREYNNIKHIWLWS